jgi:hypothetical protein
MSRKMFNFLEHAFLEIIRKWYHNFSEGYDIETFSLSAEPRSHYTWTLTFLFWIEKIVKNS